jgi:hypothetical protein
MMGWHRLFANWKDFKKSYVCCHEIVENDRFTWNWWYNLMDEWFMKHHKSFLLSSEVAHCCLVTQFENLIFQL